MSDSLRDRQGETEAETERRKDTERAMEGDIRILMIYSFRPLPLMKGFNSVQIQFNLKKLNFNYPTRGNFVVVMA